MKRFLTVALLLAAFHSVNAQNQISELGCATTASPQELQKVYDYVKNTPARKTTAAVDSIPLSIHIVGTDAGTGYYKLEYLFKVICELNVRYAPVDFFFYIKWPIRYINNSTYYEHDFNAGWMMMGQHNVNNAVNVYFVQDPAGACGYYSPGGDAVAIGKSCSLPGSTTLVHELGHYFGLPHTFSGWEHGNTPFNPEKVTRGAGANCSFAGDGFCDTDADYISDRWSCPYNKVKYDTNGDLYHPDSSIYMSYSSDKCQTRFSGQQIGFMQNELYSTYAYLLNSKPIPYTTLAAPNILYPTDSVHSNFTKVIWNKVPGAEYYHVKITSGIAQLTRHDTLVSDTVFNITYKMSNLTEYKLYVAPVSSVNTCMVNSTTKPYIYTDNTTPLTLANFSATGSTVRITPNPVYGNDINVFFDAVKPGTYTLKMVNINGQVVAEQQIHNQFGNYNATIPTSTIAAGLYFIQITGQGEKWMHKVVVHK
jgi:hypothetical protein